MTKSCSKKIVVLRDIPSNMIEEAIIVLKNDSFIDEKSIDEKNKIEKKRDFLILREAETIIENFIRNSRNSLCKPSIVKKVNKKWYIDLIINTGLIAGVSVFIYLIIKAF